MRRVLGISSVLTLNDIGRIDFVHARRIGHRLGPPGGWCRLLPKTIALRFPDQVPLRSGISSCARGSNYGAKQHQREKKHLIAFLRFDRCGFRRTSPLPLFRRLTRAAVL